MSDRAYLVLMVIYGAIIGTLLVPVVQRAHERDWVAFAAIAFVFLIPWQLAVITVFTKDEQGVRA